MRKANGKTKGGKGFLHIVNERMVKDGATLDEAIETAIRVGIAAELGTETKAVMNTRWLDYGGVRAIIALTSDGKPIITGYEVRADGNMAAFPPSTSLRSRPVAREAEIVAALKDILSNSGAGAQGGAAKFSAGKVEANPNLKRDIEAALRTNKETGGAVKRRTVVEFSKMPPLLSRVGLPDRTIETRADVVRKLRTSHGLTPAQIAELPARYSDPAAVFKDGNDFIVLTDLSAKTHGGEERPVMVLLRPWKNERGEKVFLASAYPREKANEDKYVSLAKKGLALYVDKVKIATVGLEERTNSTLSTLSNSGDFKDSIPQNGAGAQGGAAKFAAGADAGGEIGARHNFIASAYAREANKEQSYVDLIRGGKLIYMDESRIAASKLEDATLLQFKPQAVRGDFKDSISQNGVGAQVGRFSVDVTPEQDAAYAEAVARGDTETARRSSQRADWRRQRPARNTLMTRSLRART